MRTAVLAVAGVAALASVRAATSAKTASRIVDRTLLCTMTGVGYPDPVRILDVSASSQDPKLSTLPAQIYASNGPGTFAGVRTGFDRDGTSRIGIVSWTRGCSATKLVVPLSGARLVGGPVASREFTNVNRVRVLVFTGAASSPEPNQDVEIVAEDCGTRGNRLFAATRTTVGGAYQATNENSSIPWSSGVTFRARWNGHLSAPIQYRLPAVPFYASKMPGRRAWKVQFSPSELRVKYTGKPVELQRFADGRWVRYRTARLKHKPTLRYGGAFNHEAVFEVPRRGLRLRGYLPAQSAAPCWLPNATEPWRS